MLLYSLVIVLVISGAQCRDSLLEKLLTRLLDEKQTWEVEVNNIHPGENNDQSGYNVVPPWDVEDDQQYGPGFGAPGEDQPWAMGDFHPFEVTLSDEYMQQYPPKNHRVDLRFHDITAIATNAFLRTPDVTAIDLRDNSIREVADDAFHGLENLISLDLANNELTELSFFMLAGPENLTFLDLSHNAIHSIARRTFTAFPKLETLHLQFNDLGSLDFGMLYGLDNLKTLFVYNNKISSIESGTFAEMGRLWRLFMSSNRLASLEEGTLEGLSSLTNLHLDDNNIKSLNDAFSGLGRLELLDLKKNRLTELSNTTFIGARSLDKIYLEKNHISTIEEGIFEGLRRPVTISLTGNPLECDSALCWLRHQIEARAVWNTGSLRCNDGTSWYTRDWDCAEPDVECGEIPEVDFSNAYDLWEGVKVSYVCWDCYQGGGTIECGENGNWSPAPACTRVCPEQ